jgi:glycosyltransferase involved in cell wall biosynthesis
LLELISCLAIVVGPDRAAPSPPLASVVVRSYRRPKALRELLDRLCRQRYPRFEIVVVEQSGDPTLLASLATRRDPRLRVLERPPLGAPGARNEGVRHARGEVILFVDDDDLPIGDDWIEAHMANYADPLCMGVNGRLAAGPQGAPVPRFPRLVRWASLRHTPFKDPWTFAFGSLRKEGIDFLVGSNASVRRSLIERIGGWDEGIPMGEEQSFAFKFARDRRPGERLSYDPRPQVWRRVNINGGLDRRSCRDWYRRDLEGRVIYYHGVVGHYFPWRFRLLYPLFLLRVIEQVLIWLWDADNAERTFGERLRATLLTLAEFPAIEWRVGWRLDRSAIRRAPALEDASGPCPEEVAPQKKASWSLP